MSGELFEKYWESRKSALSLEDTSFIRPVTSEAPHGVALINRELVLSAWLEDGDREAVDRVVATLLSAAERMASSSPRPQDREEERVAYRVRPARSFAEVDIEGDVEDGDVEDTGAVEDGHTDEESGHQRIDYITLEIVSPNQLQMKEYLSQYVDGIRVMPPKLVKPSNDSFSVKFSFHTILDNAVEHSGQHLSLGLIRMGALLPLLEEGEKIYNLNVRAALSTNTITNQRLKKVFEQIASGEDSGSAGFFPFLNNGLTISYGGKSALSEGVWQVVNPQVINGQQTLRSWYRQHLKSSSNQEQTERLENLLVPIRLMRLLSHDAIRAVAFANNRQNPISAIDLRSNEPCMVSIEKAFRTRNRNNSYAKKAIYFLRKSGQAVTNPAREIIELKNSDSSLTPSDIYRLHCEMQAASRNEDYFFDSDEFELLFKPISENLDSRKIERLYGLYQVCRINAGVRRRPGIRLILNRLGVHGGAMGVSDSADRRLLTYALWPIIKKVIMHALIGDAAWQGTDTKVQLFTGTGAETKPTYDLMALLFPVELPSNLISSLYEGYRDWVESHDTEDMEEHEKVGEYVRDNVSLEYMLKLTEIPRASLIRDI